MSSRYSSCLSFTSPNSFCCSTWVKPMIAFSGVRSSCDMLARNSDLCVLAASSSLVQPLELVVHAIDVDRERAEFVAVDHLDMTREVS